MLCSTLAMPDMKNLAYMYTIEVFEKSGDTTKKIQVIPVAIDNTAKSDKENMGSNDSLACLLYIASSCRQCASWIMDIADNVHLVNV